MACRNFVNLTIKQPLGLEGMWQMSTTVSKDGKEITQTTGGPFGLNDIFGKERRESEPIVAIEKEINNVLASLGTSMQDVTGWVNTALGSVARDMTHSMAEPTYKFCLADCIDDQEGVFGQSVAKCWMDAKTQDDVKKCEQQVHELRQMKKLNAQIGQLEREVAGMLTK